MRKLLQDPSKKYPFNINDPQNEHRNRLPTNLKKLTKGFYDDLEENDNQIQSTTKHLQKIKNNSIKEFVYTNRIIPDNWKKKITYQNDLIKMFVKDPNFLSYVGKGPAIEPQLPIFEDGPAGGGPVTLISDNRKLTYRNNDFSKNENKTIYSNSLMEKEHEDMTSNINSSHNVNAKYKINKKGFLTDKDIVLLLEEFKNAYPLIEQKPIIDKKKLKKEKINEKKNSLIFSRTHNLSTPFLSVNQNINDPFSNIRHMKLEKRQEAFRQSIFNNLIPPKKKLYSSKSALMRNKDQQESGCSMFLNLGRNEFNKKIEINNPIIKKHLENINYYGPYYSYCPYCRNRNLEFYNKLEAGQCLKIIQYVKKIIGKKNFLNIKKNNIESNEEDQKENNTKRIFDNVELNREELNVENESGKIADEK